MKISKSRLVQMIGEEYKRIIRLTEEDENDSSKKDKKNSKDYLSKNKESKKNEVPKGTPSKNSPAVSEIPIDDQPADDELEDEETGPEEDDEQAKKAKSKISGELVGKTVQSITMEPKSKTLPGAQEIVLTFDQLPDPLKILVTKSGKIAFYFKGLHNEL